MTRKIFTAVFIFISAVGYTQDIRNNLDFQQEQINLLSSWWHNPAMRFHYPIEKITDVSISQTVSEKNVYNVQKGDSGKDFKFLANSFTKKQDQLFYGKASYHNGLQRNVNWNTLVDVDRLYPYIVADTIPDKMRREQYFFAGGYAQRFNNTILGIYGSYHASTAFDRRDPRPHNKVTDLYVVAGVSRRISSEYNVGVDFSYDQYQQDQSLSLFKDNGSAAIYYLRGLGVADEIFSTVITKNGGGATNTYEQKSFGATISVYPNAKRGFLAALSAINRNLELYGGNLNVTISKLAKKDIKLELGYQFNSKYKLKMSGEYLMADGTEYNYDRSQKYLLNRAKKYKENRQVVDLSFAGKVSLNQSTKGNFIIWANYEAYEEKYLKIGNATINNKKISNLSLNMVGNILKAYKQSSLLLKLKANYRSNLNKELNVGTLAAENAIEELERPNYIYQSANRLYTEALVRYDYFINDKYALYLKGKFGLSRFTDISSDKKHNTIYNVGVGLSF